MLNVSLHEGILMHRADSRANIVDWPVGATRPTRDTLPRFAPSIRDALVPVLRHRRAERLLREPERPWRLASKDGPE
jgi:hypothetical protein